MDGMFGLKLAASSLLVFLAAVIAVVDDNKSRWPIINEALRLVALMGFLGAFTGAILSIWGRW